MREQTKQLLNDVLYASLHTTGKHAINFILNGMLGYIQRSAAASIGAGNLTGVARLASARALTRKDIDGRLVSGPSSMAYAKFSSRKPLPGPGNKTMGQENDPHTVDDFNGKIDEGKYGAGVKRLIFSGNVVVKIAGGRPFIAKANIHQHDAKRAGLHYDFVAEGIKPGTKSFEINVPAGEFKGRYAFRQPKGFEGNQVLIVRMKDEDVVLPKPNTKLIDVVKLQELDDTGEYLAEWKPDGGLANVVIKDNRAVFTSHREQAAAYYDKLPWIEWLKNNSRFITNRLLFKDPDLNGTVLQVELVHSEGAARTAGILNSGADKAIQYQLSNGPVRVYAWDIAKYKGRDVSGLPYEERRELYEEVISDIRHFNKFWEAVPSRTRDFVSWYNQITADPRGLPYSEGLVVKHRTDSQRWFKVKFRDTIDVEVVDFIEGIGKRANTVGRLVVETEGGGRGEVGSFRVTDEELQWMWNNREFLKGQVAEIYAQEVTKTGAPRAGVFIRWHPSKSEANLLKTSLDEFDTMYAIKSAAGWRKGG